MTVADPSAPALGDPDRVELGYWLSSEEHPPAALVEHARAAEDAGFATAMVSDHFAPWVPQQGESPFVWSVLGAIAVTTEQLRVGTGVSAAVSRFHPVTLAQAAATTAVMMPGRFFLGLGSGERLNEHFAGERWPRPGERRAMLRDTVGVVRDLLAGRTVTRECRAFRVERAMLHTRPATPPPIAVAAGGKRSAALAGAQGDAMLAVAPDPDLVDAFEHAGGRGKARLAKLEVCFAPDERDARRTAHRWWPNAAVAPSLLPELALPREIADAARTVDEEAVAREVVCGPDPERYVHAIHRRVAAGFTTVYLHQVGPDQQAFLEFAKGELLPRFAAP